MANSHAYGIPVLGWTNHTKTWYHKFQSRVEMENRESCSPPHT